MYQFNSSVRLALAGSAWCLNHALCVPCVPKNSNNYNPLQQTCSQSWTVLEPGVEKPQHKITTKQNRSWVLASYHTQMATFWRWLHDGRALNTPPVNGWIQQQVRATLLHQSHGTEKECRHMPTLKNQKCLQPQLNHKSHVYQINNGFSYCNVNEEVWTLILYISM